MALLEAFLRLVIWVNQFLRRTLTNLLAFLAFLDRTARSALVALTEFSRKLGRAMLSISWTLARIALFYLPGAAIAYFFRGHILMVTLGVAYMVLITLVGIFYRPEQEQGKPVRVNVTWLSYFPLTWTQDRDFAPILADFTNAYDDLRLSRKNADSDLVRAALTSILGRMDRHLRWTSQTVRNARKLRRLQGKLKNEKLIAAIEARIDHARQRLGANLDQFREAMAALGDVNLALDDHQDILEGLNPVEGEIILLERFKRALKRGGGYPPYLEPEAEPESEPE